VIPVLWVTQVYPRGVSDPLGRFLHLLARELPARGFAPTVVAPAADGAPREATIDGVRVLRFRYAAPGRQTLAYTGEMHRQALRHPARFAAFLRSMRRAVADAVAAERPAVIHAHWWAPSGLASSPVAARERIPLAVSLHGTDVRLLANVPIARPIARRVLAQAQAILPVSSALLREVERLRLGGAPRDVLPMPADPATFHPGGGGEEGPPEFVVAARLTRQKRVDLAIRAMALVEAAPGPRLHVAGDGPERASLASLARSSGLGDRGVFHGMMEPEDLAALFRRSRAVVLPSVGEGYGLALVEGALCGAPGIGARSGGIQDLVEDGVTGLLFEPGRVEELAAALGRLAADPGLARELGERARARALLGTPEPLAERLAALYGRLAPLTGLPALP
jgi:glycosyltransferase involved in cell wall biosynthesis